MSPQFRRTRLRRLGDALIAPLVRLGVAGKRTHILTVTGRKTGKPYSTPVQLVFLDGERWLVSPYGERQWVKNARVAGSVELTRGRRTEVVRVEEVDPATAAPVLREYARNTPITRPYFRDETVPHPVFRISGEGARIGA